MSYRYLGLGDSSRVWDTYGVGAPSCVRFLLHRIHRIQGNCGRSLPRRYKLDNPESLRPRPESTRSRTAYISTRQSLPSPDELLKSTPR